MKVIEHLERAKAAGKQLFSCEIVPPARGKSVNEIIQAVEVLQTFDPSWIDVTSHTSTTYFRENNDGTITKKTFRKRPGTLGICGVIQNRFRIDTVAHILCMGFSREETEDALIELNFLGIHNVLALRGDAPNMPKPSRPDRTVNAYASDLVAQIADMRQGKFLDELEGSNPLEFCVGVAGYPEKHFEAPSLKLDIQHLKKKIEAGAEYIVTQMFFDNSKYFAFVKACREAGITVPIVPGLKLLKSVGQLRSLPKAFHMDLPDALVDEVMENSSHALEIGKRWCLKQSEELLNGGAPGLHYYVLNDASEIADVVRKLRR